MVIKSTAYRVRAFGFSAALLALAAPALATNTNLPWVGTWAVSPEKMNPVNYGGKTLREVVHTSVAGDSVRAHFSNRFGDTPLTISNVHAALRDAGSSVKPSSDVELMFGGNSTVTLAPGESTITDPVPFAVPAVSDVMISFYIPVTTNVTTGHSFSNQSKYVANGDVASATAIDASEDGDYYFLTNLDVQGRDLRGTLVTFGASVTDGYQSSQNANRRWPNDLAVLAAASKLGLGVVNQGITGNNLFNDGAGDESGLKRYDRDALSQPGVRWVIFSDVPGNDFINGVPEATAPNVIVAYQNLMDRTHSLGVKFICATLTPFGGYRLSTPEKDALRTALNDFMRSPDSGCDAVIDADAVVRDPDQPARMREAFDSGDHLHPNDVGYQAMADAIDLSLFPVPSAVTETAPTICGDMEGGEALMAGQPLASCDGRFSLLLQGDGNLTLSHGATQLISTNTSGSDAAALVLGRDGNLVLRGILGEPLWQSSTGGHPGARLFLQEDGNAVIYAQEGAIWSTNTQGQ